MRAAFLQSHPGQVGPVDPDPPAPELPGGAAEIVRFFMEMPRWVQIGGAVVGALAALVAAWVLWTHRRRVVRWVVELPLWVKGTALAAVVAGGTVAAVAGYQVYDYVEHDNEFCTGCHLMAEAFVRFDESPHAELGCKDCHAQSKLASARQLYLWVLERPGEVGSHSPVPDARCTSCHVDEDPEDWPQIAASLGHRVHFDSDDPELGELMCVTCHGVSVHEFTPAEETCGECHEEEASVRLGRMTTATGLHCVACHDFLATEPTELPGTPEGIAVAMLPERTQCVSCHEMEPLLAQGELDDDPHGAVCGACHDPHTQDEPAEAVSACTDCHEGSDTLTVFHSGTHAPVHETCTECHSAHSWTVNGSDCLSCHESVIEASADRRPYSGEADPDGGSGGSAATRTAWPFLAMHGAGDLPGAAQESRGRFAAPFPPDTLPDRPFTHQAHETLGCTECHGTADEHGVLTVNSPEDCAACHHDPGQPYECQECHGPDRTEGVRDVVTSLHFTVWENARTRSLPFEHELHQDFECDECHTGSVMLDAERPCSDCHDDHHRPEAQCVRCHDASTEDPHALEAHLTCSNSGCHGEAAAPPTRMSRQVCLACHREEEDHEPGLDCRTCHMVPDLAPQRRGTSISGSGEEVGW